jgi:hypothetical protein
MHDEHTLAHYRRWYRQLLRLHSRPYRERFGESMEQTFNDLCRDRAEAGGRLVGLVFWIFAETSAGIFREKVRFIMMQNLTRRLLLWAVVVGLILLVPLLAMQLNWNVPDPGSPAHETVNWSVFDFVVAGILLFGSALTYEVIAAKGGNTAYRAAVGIACGAGLLLVWLNLAVGLIGSEDNPANVMYIGVLVVGLVGAGLARLAPRGMARALFATAVAQALVPLIALTIWRPPIVSGVAQVLGVNALFVALWVVSALLFRQAAEREGTASRDPRGSAAG